MKMSVEGLEYRVIEWARERGIFAESTEMTRYKKMAEEFEEFTDELIPTHVGERDMDKVKLEAGDVLVTLINILHPLGLDLETCLQAAYVKIKDRKGKMVNGTFVREVE
jgi:NTP pyrophosphatase (non-canonical NTP hydrolase)